MKKRRYTYYVVWQGFQTGVFADSLDFFLATKGYHAAKFKGFNSMIEAEKAYSMGYRVYFEHTQNLLRFVGP